MGTQSIVKIIIEGCRLQYGSFYSKMGVTSTSDILEGREKQDYRIMGVSSANRNMLQGNSDVDETGSLWQCII